MSELAQAYPWAFAILALMAGVLLTLLINGWVRRSTMNRLRQEAEKKAEQIHAEARREGERIEKEASITAKETLFNAKAEADRQMREGKQELSTTEKRLGQKEESLERKIAQLDDRQEDLKEREKRLSRRESQIKGYQKKLESAIEEQQTTLQKISGFTKEEAKGLLVRSLKNEARLDCAREIKKMEDEARREAENRAKRLVSLAIQRCASEYVIETTVSVVDLPNEEMKGRIIGREGRNIRALEVATGVDLIVDDTPEAVILSAFDSIRREVARISIERLVSDGRIHPARIEETVNRVRTEMEKKIEQEGEAAVFELGLADVHPELVKLLGRLRYRTSYGQAVLEHSKEVSRVASVLAKELGVNERVAKRAGLLHDIGKAVDRETEGTHTEIGVELARKYGESEAVVHGIAYHHLDIEPQSVEAVLVQAADAISAARPGARREVFETYLRRLEKLEHIAETFDGVAKCFAVQAGREIRIIVESDNISDEEAVWLSKDIARKIESELEYPGQIKVTVIRETRAVDYAR